MNINELIETYLNQDSLKLSLEIRKSFVKEAMELLEYQENAKEDGIDVNELLHLWNAIPPFNNSYTVNCDTERLMELRRNDISSYQVIREQMIKNNYLPDDDELELPELWPDLTESRFKALGIITPERLQSTAYSIKFVNAHTEDFLKMIHTAIKVLVTFKQQNAIIVESISLTPAAATCSRIGNGLEFLVSQILLKISQKLPEKLKQDGKQLVNELFQHNLKVHTLGEIRSHISSLDPIQDIVSLRPWGMTSVLFNTESKQAYYKGHTLRLRRPWQSPLIKDWVYYSGKEITQKFNTRTTQLVKDQQYAGIALQMLAFALSAIALSMPTGRGKSRPCWVETPLTVPILSAALIDYAGIRAELLSRYGTTKD